jgi:uncharacterized protein YggE
MKILVFAAGALIASQAAQAADSSNEPRIIVEGEGSVRTPPDVATVSYELRGEGKTSDDAARSLAEKASRVENSLRSIDQAIEPKAGAVRIAEARGSACKTDEYDDEPRLSVGACAVVGYIATQRVSARTSRSEDSGTLVGLASRNGATNAKIDSFELGDDKAQKKQAIAVAIANARVKAEAIAESSGIALGPVLSIALDRADDDSEMIVVTGARLNSPNLLQSTPVQIRVSPQPIETSAKVTVSFTIQR